MRWIGALAFTLLVPGTVTVVLPYMILDAALPWDRLGPNLRSAGGVVLLAAGLALYGRCLFDFVTSGRGLPSPVDHPKKLVVRGPYRYVRNPMYLGVLGVLSGEALLFASFSLLAYAGAFLAVVHVVVLLYEEPYLRHRFGDGYEGYRRRVRRWLPGRPYGGDEAGST